LIINTQQNPKKDSKKHETFPNLFYYQVQLQVYLIYLKIIKMRFALVPLGLSFLALTTSVVTAPVATESKEVSTPCMFSCSSVIKTNYILISIAAAVRVTEKRAYYYYGGPEQPAEAEKRAYYYYGGPEQPAEAEKRAYYYYGGPEQPAEGE
jgi:hypothetical protein